MKQHFLAAAAESDKQLDTRNERETLALAAIEHAEDLGRAGVARTLEQGERVGIELAPCLVHRVERDNCVLELVIGLALDRLARAIDAIDVAVTDELACIGRLVRDWAIIDPLPGPTGLTRKAVFAHQRAAGRAFQRVAVLSLRKLGAGITARPRPAGLGDRDTIDDPGDRIAVCAGFGVLLT